MKMKQMVQMTGYLSLASLFVLSGCATQAAAPANTSPAQAEVMSADQSSPAVPAIATASVIEVEEVAVIKIPEPEPEPEPGSVAAVLKKMETSPYTLFWRGKNTYSYFIGGVIDAEYEPGKRFTVKQDLADGSGISCQYDNAGMLDSKLEQDVKAKETCSKLMLTLDDELSD